MNNQSIDWQRVEALFGADVLAYLRDRRVGIVGLGSGGGFVALSLAMSGVGHFVLIDDDVLSPANVVRHAADLRDVGRPKVQAVADLLRQRNPQVDVRTVIGRVEEHVALLANVDIVIAGVDGEQAKYAINQACLERGRVAVYAGVYERGQGGDVCIIYPDKGPCYACWAEQVRANMTEAPAEELDYGMIGPDGTLAAEPGLWLDVVRVAAVQADVALGHLLAPTEQRQALPANTVILANTYLEIFEGQTALPYTAEWITVERNPQCLVCGSRWADNAPQAFSLQDLAAQGNVTIEEDDDEL